MGLIKTATVDCPECGSAALMRIYPFGIAAFRCPNCGARSVGRVMKVPKESVQDGDVVVRMKADPDGGMGK